MRKLLIAQDYTTKFKKIKSEKNYFPKIKNSFFLFFTLAIEGLHSFDLKDILIFDFDLNSQLKSILSANSESAVIIRIRLLDSLRHDVWYPIPSAS